MKYAGVAIDTWKLPIFKRHLNEAGFSFTRHKGLTKDTLILKVECEWVNDLKPVVEAANKECANVGVKK